MPDAFRLRHEDFRFVGSGLSRPECVIAAADGGLWVSDQRATAMRIDPDGSQRLVGTRVRTANGLALDRDGTLYAADIDDECVYRVGPDGTQEIVLPRVGGAVNFVLLDGQGRLWTTVSTRTVPRAQVLGTPTPDGFILLSDASGVRTVADGLCFTNEVRLDAAERYLYIVETALGRVQRRAVHADGQLGAPEPFGPAPVFEGAKLDGICFDAQGQLWATEITRNALLLFTADGQVHTVFEDPEGRTLDFPTSLAFGGPDRRTVYVGSLRMDRLASFRSPWPGQPLRHWS